MGGLASLGGHGTSQSELDSTTNKASKELFGLHGRRLRLVDALTHLPKTPSLDLRGRLNEHLHWLLYLIEFASAYMDDLQDLDLQ